MINFLKILFINISIFILGIVIIDLFFGTWLKKSNYSNLLIPRQQTNIIDNFPYEHDTLGIYSRDKYGFRANKYDLNSIDILVLGGSTTEERDVDDKKIWTKVLEKNLKTKYKVLNAGIGGQTSYGHKLMFNMWFKKYKELKPYFIIVYLGINDALFLVENVSNNNFIFNGRQINLSNRDTLVNINISDQIIQYIKNNSVFHSLYLIIKGNIISNKYKVSYNSKPSIFIDSQEKIPENVDSIDKNIINSFKEYYYQNLTEIIEYSKIYNSKIIFVTQNVSNSHWLNKYIKIINSFTLNFCIINKVRCIDFENKSLKLTDEDFYDGIHTTPAGSKKIGQFIAKEFNNFNFKNLK